MVAWDGCLLSSIEHDIGARFSTALAKLFSQTAVAPGQIRHADDLPDLTSVV
jgi:hypothetical protein